jgi:hypothetical protein
MSLYWVIRDLPDGKFCFLQDAASPLDAQMRSDAAGFHGKLADVIHLDVRTAARIRTEDIGRVLSMDQAREIIAGRKA